MTREEDEREIEIISRGQPRRICSPGGIDKDEKDFIEYWLINPGSHSTKFRSLKQYKRELDIWIESRRTLREKIKADLSICKLEIEDWPESPDY